jgi:BrnA antitoxin of type II toxin-antitoxin system
MKKEYDFSKGKRGPVLPVDPGKVRVTIRLDKAILEWFRDQVEQAHGGNYQTLINDALRGFIQGQRQPSLEQTLRKVIREELRRASRRRDSPLRALSMSMSRFGPSNRATLAQNHHLAGQPRGNGRGRVLLFLRLWARCPRLRNRETKFLPPA